MEMRWEKEMGRGNEIVREIEAGGELEKEMGDE
jgi:hypothetical protein